MNYQRKTPLLGALGFSFFYFLGVVSFVQAVVAPVVAYSQPNHDTEITLNSITLPSLFTGVEGTISQLRFAYNDNGAIGEALWMGVSIIDFTAGTNNYAYKEGIGIGCGDAVQIIGTGEKTIVELDESFSYVEYPCTGAPLVLDPTHTYGIALFQNRGVDPWTPRPTFYGSSNDPASVFLEITVTQKESCVQQCFSNVLFLPGIKGSILRKEGDRLWPPTALGNDVPQLALTDSGESIHDIYVDGIVNSFSVVPIYQPFSDFMDEMVAQGDIAEWLPLGYDWRLPLERVVEDGIKTSDGVVSVVDRVLALAESSKTGKVVIVGHSMGGLLGKVIIKALEDQGSADIVESFVMVGTPQLGTPQAIGGLLHGDEETLAHGLFVEGQKLRTIARNMPSGYYLLPSRTYFERVNDPVIVFDNAAFTDTWRTFWGNTITTFDSMTQFITATGVSRDRPFEFDILKPEVLRSDLVDYAAAFHELYDDYLFPEHIRVVQIAGWGVDTIKAVRYKMMHGAPFFTVDHTKEGDKTVVFSSATAYQTDEVYYLNLNLLRYLGDEKIDHKNLLTASHVHEIIDSLIKKEVFEENIFISKNKPSVTDLEDELLVTTNSPVILGVYDENNNFTGIVQDQDLEAEILEVEETIPGSSFSYTAGSQTIFVPQKGKYTFVYKGIGAGPTTLEIETFSNDTPSPVATYTDIPTNSTTKAQLVVESSFPASALLIVDSNGDGSFDTPVLKDNPTVLDMVSFLRQKIILLDMSQKFKQSLLALLSKVEKKLQKDKKKGGVVLLKTMEQIVDRIEKRQYREKIPDQEAGLFLDLLTRIERMI